MAAQMRRTNSLQRVARVLLADVDSPHWGYRLARQAQVTSAAVYPMLAKLQARGYLSASEVMPSVRGPRYRPARRCYRVTSSGRDFLELAASGPTVRPSRRRGQAAALPLVEAIRRGRRHR